MAFYQLVVVEQKTPTNPNEIMKCLYNLNSRIKVGKHYTKTEDRINNINTTKGLIENYFVYKNPPSLGHGPGLIIDFENSIRRSKIESSKYEFKQGILKLSKDRSIDYNLLQRLINTICGIANSGPQSDGYIFIGVCDKEADANRIEKLDSITPIKIGEHYVTGIDREAKVLNISLDEYIKIITQKIQCSDLTEPLKTQVLANFDTILYKGLSVLRIRIPKQTDISFVGKKAYSRINSSTTEIQGLELIALHNLFEKKD